LDDQLILKEGYTQSYDYPVAKHVATYKYYCNGQLKSETSGGDYPSHRKDYRYHGGVDCPLEEEGKSLLLFPNPTEGRFTIQSNLLSNSATTIQVFTILGKRFFLRK
jgi:hypothetical protein